MAVVTREEQDDLDRVARKGRAMARKKTETWQERLNAEYIELMVRIRKLEDFQMSKDHYHLDGQAQATLATQLYSMRQYRDILMVRLNRLPPSS